ncbi:MAG: hypothetical protein WDW36_007242 [Sanguina aurantia]
MRQLMAAQQQALNRAAVGPHHQPHTEAHAPAAHAAAASHQRHRQALPGRQAGKLLPMQLVLPRLVGLIDMEPLPPRLLMSSQRQRIMMPLPEGEGMTA